MTRRLLIFVALLVVFTQGLFWGLQLYFPGETLARFLTRSIEQRTSFQVEMEPVVLHRFDLVLPRAQITLAEDAPPLQIEDLRVDLLDLLFARRLSLDFGGLGRLSLQRPWGSDTVFYEVTDLDLSVLPLPASIERYQPAGLFALDGQIEMATLRALTGAPAESTATTTAAEAALLLTATLRGLSVSELSFFDRPLPALQIEQAEVKLSAPPANEASSAEAPATETASGAEGSDAEGVPPGNSPATETRLRVDRCQLAGDVSGECSGFIQLDHRRPSESQLAVDGFLALAPRWIEGTDAQIRPILEGIFKEGRLRFDLRGTLGAPLVLPDDGWFR